MKWSDLPQTAKTDAALRRAAAEVCEFYGGHGSVPGLHDPSEHYRLVCAWEDWLPDQNRDQLARVFRAAYKTGRGVCHYQDAWLVALRDPRAALCTLLDLLNIEPPEELNDE